MDDREVVSALRESVCDRVGLDLYQIWFGKHVQWELAPGKLTLFAAGRFRVDRIRQHFLDRVREAAIDLIGRSVEFDQRMGGFASDYCEGNSIPITIRVVEAEPVTLPADESQTSQLQLVSGDEVDSKGTDAGPVSNSDAKSNSLINSRPISIASQHESGNTEVGSREVGGSGANGSEANGAAVLVSLVSPILSSAAVINWRTRQPVR